MTTGGDVIYGGASGTPERLANGTAGQVLTSQGSTNPPIWSSFGNALHVLKTFTGTDSTVTSSSYVDISGYVNQSFSVPVDSTVSLILSSFVILGSGTNVQFQIQAVFDSAGTPINAEFQPDGAGIGSFGHGGRTAQVDLTAGAHTVKLQWKKVSGDGSMNADSAFPMTLLML